MYFEMWWNDLINYEVISPHFKLCFCKLIFLYYTYCGLVRPVVAWEFWCQECGEIHITVMKLSGWLQIFCLFGGELCNCTLTDRNYLYCGLYLAFVFVSQYYYFRLFVMISPATLQSDSVVLLRVTSVMLGGFNGPNRLLELDNIP
jgi:hypothetical protein